jgi:hypothetical protein
MKIKNNLKLEFYPRMRRYFRAINSSSALLACGTRGLCIALVAACIAFVPKAGAITFDGNTSGEFVNPAGPAGMVTNFIYNWSNGDRVFEWGTAVPGYMTSAIGLVPTTFAGVQTDQYFSLGDFAYRNGEIYDGTQADSVDLMMHLVLSSGTVVDYGFNLGLINTVNTANPVTSADTVLLSAYFPTTFFTVGGINYSLNVGLGTLSGFSPTNAFTVAEGGFAMTKIVGIITAQTPPSVPDSGYTLALMAIAVVGLGGLRQYVARKA